MYQNWLYDQYLPIQYWQKEDKIFDISNTANPINNKLDFKRDHLS